MIILLIMLLIIISCALAIKIIDDDMSPGYITFGIIGITVSVLLIIALLAIPIAHYNSSIFIEQHKMMETVVENSRNNESSVNGFENATLTMKIIDHNKELISRQHDNESVFDIWVDDDVMNLKPINTN